MPWYIRFVKVPEVNRAQYPKLTFSFEIRNDLGEALYPGPAAISILLESLDASDVSDCEPAPALSETHQWTGSSWTSAVTLDLSTYILKHAAQIRVTLDYAHRPQTPPLKPQLVPVKACADLAYIHGTTSAFLAAIPGTKSEPFALRRLPGGLQVWEGTGSSIAAHVWDAGMVLCGHLAFLASDDGEGESSPERNELGKLLKSTTTGQLRVLELGAGCGISSLVLGQLFGARIGSLEITDLDEAMELVEKNVKLVRDKGEVELEQCSTFALDWGSERDRATAAGSGERDLILVSDCTYNVDAVGSLVMALQAVACPAQTLIAVALKRRHEDEVKFFHDMDTNGFVHIRKHVFSMPASKVEQQFGVEPSDIELHLYRPGPP